MTPQELKNSILQLAIQGKLVEQRPEEGTAAELVEKIARHGTHKTTRTHGTKSRVAHRASFVPSVSSVSSVPVVSPIPDDEKPFDIPESWEWVRLGEIAESIQYGYSAPARQSGRIRMIRISDIQNGKINWETVPFCDILENDIGRYLVESGDILFARTGGTVGKSYLVRDVPQESIYAGYLIRTRFLKCVLPQYAKTFFESDIYWKQLKDGLIATAQPNFNGKKLALMLIPLPPLAEQKRIVAKIEELLPLIDRYEKAWSKLEDFNKRFPVDMQKSLLQMAIQGKLVEQRAEEGTGEELLEKILAAKNAKSAKKNSRAESQSRREKKTSALSASLREKIPDDEKPFDIPESWEWVRLSSVTDMLSGFAFKSTDFKANGKYRLLRGINLGVDDVRWKETVYVDYITERMAEYRLKSGDVLIGLDRPWISDGTRVAIFNDSKETYLVQRVLRLRETGLLTSAFIALLLRSSLLSNSIGDKTTGISVPHISPGQVGNLVIPLPPLAEQKRIVAKLEELLPLCERLK